MSLDKSEVKLGTVHELGCRLDDVREAAHKEVSRMEGAVAAFAKSAEVVAALAALVDKDISDGKFELETATLIKRYIERGTQALTNLHLNAKNLQLMAQGKVQGLDAGLQVAKKLKEEEERKRDVVQEAVQRAAEAPAAQEATEAPRPTTIKAQRLAEERLPLPASQLPPKKGRRKR
jgi:hypothetical protein